MDYLLAQCQQFLGTGGGIILSLFLAGLVGSLAHCSTMCGPLVFSRAGEKGNCACSEHTCSKRSTLGVLLVPYHLGRMTTYVILGMIAALLSRQIIGTSGHSVIAASMLGLAGLLFLLTAAGGSRVHLPFLEAWHHRLGKFTAPFMWHRTWKHGYLTGIVLGFMPCGLVYAALMAVAATGSPAQAALGMVVFTAGTAPMLTGIAGAGQLFMNKWPGIATPLLRGVMACNGLFLCFMAGKLVV
ncbi:MAG: sulfite exporter TauE/SafE family protein [Hyphomicrobiales bacterium]|nr:sulfite exporter TauE/SafE family protein [Rickettsiales bacterium]MCP5361352.1 sulfite exporter TauE/SafE family protein [Hyphomicrobiales bacterium]